MKLAIIIAAFAAGCTTSSGDPCTPDRAGMVPADWVDPDILAIAETEGVEVCFLDQQMRRARFNECRPTETPSTLQTDEQQLQRCIDRATVKSWQEPIKRECLAVLAASPCHDLEAGPCAIGLAESPPTCYAP